MTIDAAARILADMYAKGGDREKVVNIHLFAIKYAGEINSMNAHEIAERAGISRSYGTEIYKGIRLAKYVELKQ